MSNNYRRIHEGGAPESPAETAPDSAAESAPAAINHEETNSEDHFGTVAPKAYIKLFEPSQFEFEAKEGEAEEPEDAKPAERVSWQLQRQLTNELQDNTDAQSQQDRDNCTYYKPSNEAVKYYEKLMQDKHHEKQYVVAVAGKSRIGKTTFLKHCFGLNEEDLKIDAGDKTVTKGIDQLLKKVSLIGKQGLSATVLDCQGLNNQQDLDLSTSEFLDAGQHAKALKTQDVLLLATLALYSGVILYYYTAEIPAEEIATILEACKLLNVWKNEGASDYPLTKAQQSNYKTKFIFMRQNTPKDYWDRHTSIDRERGENALIFQTFDVIDMHLPEPLLSKQIPAYDTRLYKYEELDDGYQQRLRQIRDQVNTYLQDDELPQNLSSNFIPIAECIEEKFLLTMQSSIENLIQEETNRMRDLKQKQLKRRVIAGTAICVLSFFLFIFLKMALLSAGAGKMSACLATQAQVNSGTFWGSLFDFSTPKCHECYNPKFYLDRDQIDCIPSCPVHEWAYKLDGPQTADKQKTCTACESMWKNCHECDDETCTKPKEGYFVEKLDDIARVKRCDQAIFGCAKCSIDGSICHECLQDRYKFNEKCIIHCEHTDYFNELKQECTKCPTHQRQSKDDPTECDEGICKKANEYMGSDGKCQECPEYYVPDKDENGIAYKCKKPDCGRLSKIKKDGTCEKCPPYFIADEQKGLTECVELFCKNNEFITEDSVCTPCPEGQLQDFNDRTKCQPKQCAYNQKVELKKDADGKKIVECIDCPDYMVSDATAAYMRCNYPECPEFNMKPMKKPGPTKQCYRCPDYQIQDKANPLDCIVPTCEANQIIEKTGACMTCDPYSKPSKDLTQCVKPKCEKNEIMKVDGSGCEACPKTQIPNQEQTACIAPVCDVPLVFYDNACNLCPQFTGYSPANAVDQDSRAKCVQCEQKGCVWCTKDYKTCDSIGAIEHIVQNAKGHMGTVTFTLEWTKEGADLDLSFVCKENNNEKICYKNKISEYCDASLDIDMQGSDYDFLRADGMRGQLENLYVNKLTDKEEYDFSVKWFKGFGQTNYQLYVSREFCGEYLQKSLKGKNNICGKEIVKKYSGEIKKGDVLDFKYTHDATLKFQDVGGFEDN